MNAIEIKVSLTSLIVLLAALLIVVSFYFTMNTKLEVLRSQVNTVEHRYGDYGALEERISILENNQRREN
tara:strand:+ start:60 stop:269 length:210 start_codon:yes stop_codon:yes gene_type:complete